MLSMFALHERLNMRKLQVCCRGMHKHIRVLRVGKHLKLCGWSRRKSDCTSHPKCEKGGIIVSVHRTILTAVLQRSVAAHARTALAESLVSEDVSDAAAASPDVTATNREGCAATCDFSGREGHPQSCPCRNRNDGDYERCASGHVSGVMEPRADAGPGILSPGGSGTGKSADGITVMGYPKIRLVA